MSRPHTSRYIPQDNQKLREGRTQLLPTCKTQTAFAKAMTEEMQKAGGSSIDQPRLSRLFNGDEATSILELLALAKLFQIPPSKLLRPELQEYCEESESIRLQTPPTEAETDSYLTALESDGRILAFSQFPSYLFYTDKQPQRQAQFNSPSFENWEYYALDAYLNFLFAVSNRFSLSERLAILERYIDYFDTGRRGKLNGKHIVFFSRHTFPTLSRFSNMEFFSKKGLIIMLAPILQDGKGDIFLEIRNKHLCEKVDEFYTEQIDPIGNPINLLKTGRKTLQKRLEGMYLEDAIQWFYQECILCMPDSNDPSHILANFSPEVQKLLLESPTTTT